MTARREHLLAIVTYAALTTWWLWPLPRVALDHSMLASRHSAIVAADYYLIVWELAWGAHALVAQPGDLFRANIFHPSREALAYSEHLLGQQPVFAPVFWATGNAILGVNSVVLASHVFSALAMYALARRFSLRWAAALVAGFFYAFYPWRYDLLVHPYLLQVQYLPLIVLFLDRWLERARTRDLAGLAACLLLQALASFYVAYVTALVVVCVLPALAWRWRQRLDARRVGGVVAAVVCVSIPFVATALPYLRLRASGLIPTYGAGAGRVPSGLEPGIGGMLAWYVLRAEGVGPVGYALALIALVGSAGWRGERASSKGAVVVAAVVALAGSMAAFGPAIPLPPFGAVLPSPYALAARWVPGASAIRSPVRFFLAAQVGFAWLTGIGVATVGALLARRRSRRSTGAEALLAAAVMAAALLTYRPYPELPPRREATGSLVPAPYLWLREHGEGRPLLELPLASFAEAAQRMYFSTYHWLPIVDGYSAYPRAPSSPVRDIAPELPGAAAVARLIDDTDIGWVLVHRDRLPESERERWAQALPGGLEVAGAWGGDLLLTVRRR